MGKCYVKAYYDWIEQTAALSDAERGRLFIAILQYARSGLEPKLDGREGILFPVFRATLDRDDKISATNSKNGSLGGRGNKANESERKRNKADESEQKPPKDTDKEKEKKESAVSQPVTAALDEFFNSVWRLYPVKRGKGQVSQSKRLILYKIGFEKISLAISRYLEELKGDTWRKPQNGSTFFNSGYVDYLDANYTPNERMNANGGITGNTGQTQRIGHYI